MEFKVTDTETGNVINVGDTVRVECTRGWLTASPVVRIIEGIAYRDDEGVLRVEDVNLERDAAGYFMPGVTLLSTSPAKA